MHKTSNNGDNTINAHKLNMKSIALLKKMDTLYISFHSLLKTSLNYFDNSILLFYCHLNYHLADTKTMEDI